MANEPISEERTRQPRLPSESWLTLSSVTIGALALVIAALAEDAFAAANWLLVTVAIVSYEACRYWHRRTHSVVAIGGVASTLGLWMIAFVAAVVWHHTGPHSPHIFYGAVFGLWALLTAYLFREIARVKRSPPI